MSTPADQLDPDSAPQGALSTLQASPTSPAGRAWSDNYLKAHPEGVDTTGESALFQRQDADAQEARTALQKARDRLASQRMDPSILGLRFAQAMMAPSKYGIPDQWSNAAGAVADWRQQNQAFQQKQGEEDVGLAEKLQGVDKQSFAARLALQELKERTQASLTGAAMKATAKPLGPQSATSPIGKLVEDKLGVGSLQTAEGQKLFDAYQAQSHEAKTPAPGTTDQTAVDFGSYKLYKTNQMPALGMGGGAARMQILAGAAHLAQREAAGEDISNPGYDQAIANGQDFTAGNKALGSFAGGPLGNQTRSLNNAVGHLKLFDDTFAALKNHDVQALNKLDNFWSKEFGHTAPTTLQAMGQVLGPELTKILAGTNAGTGEERAQFSVTAGNLANAPEQTHDAIEGMRGMLSRQAADLALQYHGATGRSDFAKRYLASDVAESLHLNPDAAPQGASTAAPVAIKSDDDFNKLPHGALFVGPDGHTRRKP